MKAQAAIARTAQALGLRREQYADFCARVEPELNAHLRVHRFAAVPIIGLPTTPLAALTVCIDTSEGGDASATRAALARQTLRPAETREMSAEEALREASAPWLVIVRAGDVPSDSALEHFAQAAVLAPNAGLLTCDEDRLDRAGRRIDPRLRPGPSPDLMLARDDDPGLFALRRDLAAPFASCLVHGSAGRYELVLRLAGPDGAGHAHIPQILVHVKATPRPSRDANHAVVTSVLADRGSGTFAVEPASRGRRRIRRPLRSEPRVDVVVAFRDHAELLSRAALSVLELTSYERMTLRLIDNGSTDPAVPPLLNKLASDPRVLVRSDPRPFNFAALNNAAAAEGAGEMLVFLNNDTEVIEPDWIEVLAEEAQRADVGAVAPMMLYPDGTVQHVGAALGLHGYAGHPFAGLAVDATTAFGSPLDGTRNWLAVTAACMMVERRKFEAVGGFDERFVVAGNDVDLCLRLTERGWRSLCVPHTQLLHDESRSRGRHIDPGDFERSRVSYGGFRTIGDPFYHPALSLTRTDCTLRRRGEEVAQ